MAVTELGKVELCTGGTVVVTASAVGAGVGSTASAGRAGGDTVVVDKAAVPGSICEGDVGGVKAVQSILGRRMPLSM